MSRRPPNIVDQKLLYLPPLAGSVDQAMYGSIALQSAACQAVAELASVI